MRKGGVVRRGHSRQWKLCKSKAVGIELMHAFSMFDVKGRDYCEVRLANQ